MTLPETLALLNACLNATAATSMVAAWVMIRRGRRQAHRRLMLAAFGCSCLFLVSYLTRYAISGDTRFEGEGVARVVYLAILATHVLLAMAVVPLVLRTLYLALRERFDAHRRIARITYPIWAYVSVTGVVVYLMLYHWPS